MEQHSITRPYEIAAEFIKNAILQGQYLAAKGCYRIQLATYKKPAEMRRNRIKHCLVLMN